MCIIAVITGNIQPAHPPPPGSQHTPSRYLISKFFIFIFYSLNNSYLCIAFVILCQIYFKFLVPSV